MTGPQKMVRLTVEEYLAFEETAQVKHEYVNGRIFAMTGASRTHNNISLNIASRLKSLLKGSNCSVLINDFKVHAVAANSFYYPDVVVECGAAAHHEHYTEAPTVIFEVLSKSTASVDRREKLVAYQMIASLQHYVIVHQSRRRIEHYQRIGEEWVRQEISGTGDLVVECSVNAKPTMTLSMDEIYEGVQFDEGPDLQVREEAEAYVW